jgi:hypothetical protein
MSSRLTLFIFMQAAIKGDGLFAFFVLRISEVNILINAFSSSVFLMVNLETTILEVFT